MLTRTLTEPVLARTALTAICYALLACAGGTSTTRPAGPPEPSSDVFPRALIEPDTVKLAKSSFATRYDSLAPAGADWFKVVLDTGSLLLVAPHATSQTREGEVKRADAGSGSLAVILGRLTGSTASHWRRPYDVDFRTMGGQSLHGRMTFSSHSHERSGGRGSRTSLRTASPLRRTRQLPGQPPSVCRRFSSRSTPCGSSTVVQTRRRSIGSPSCYKA